MPSLGRSNRCPAVSVQVAMTIRSIVLPLIIFGSSWCSAQDFFSNPNRLATLWPTPAPTAPVWETSAIGAVFQDNFDRATLGTNWIIEGDVNAALVSNQLQLTQTNTDYTRRLYY